MCRVRWDDNTINFLPLSTYVAKFQRLGQRNVRCQTAKSSDGVRVRNMDGSNIEVHIAVHHLDSLINQVISCGSVNVHRAHPLRH